MFDARNKGQPKLVYAHMPQSDLHKTEQVSSSTKSIINVTGRNKEEQKKQPSLQRDSQQTRGQSKAGQHPQQHQNEYQQQIEMQRRTSLQQAKQVAGDFSSAKKELSATDSVQKESSMKLSSQPPATASSGTYKPAAQDTRLMDRNSDSMKTEQFKIYRGRDFEGNSEKPQLFENGIQTSSSTSSSAESEKKLIVPTVGSRHSTVLNSSNNDSSDANFLRHPRTSGNSSPIQMRQKTPPQSPNQLKHQQKLIYQQQNQHLKQQQQIIREYAPHNEDPRLHAQVVRIRSYPMGRQQVSSTLNSTLHKQANTGQPWSIPRVSTSVSTRPHSLTLPSTRSQDGVSGLQPPEKEFSNYNPSASPRALRSNFKPHSDNLSHQTAAFNFNTSSSAYNPPKSILKNNLSLEQSDLYLSSRLLPRAHSDKSPDNSSRNFDFSSILTANKNPMSPMATSIQVKGQVHGQTMTSVNSPPPQPPRPASAGPAFTNYELNKEARPIRKSVTFNSLARLHHDDRVSTVRAFSVDA